LLNFSLVTTLNETLMKHIQNNQKSIGKPIPAYGFSKSQKKSGNQTTQEIFSNCL
jgi:hypothetical protein